MTSVRPFAAKARIAPRFGKSLAAGLLACCCVLAAPSLLAQSNVSAKLIPVAKRKSAPDIPLVSSTGATQDLVGYDGKVVLLNFWATACGGCVLEIPSIVQIQNSFHGKPFTAVGVSMDVSYEGLKGPAQAWSRVRPFMHSHHVDYPVLMANKAMVHAYNIKAVPDTFLIDQHGRIAAVYHGTINPANVEANIRALLSETAQGDAEGSGREQDRQSGKRRRQKAGDHHGPHAVPVNPAGDAVAPALALLHVVVKHGLAALFPGRPGEVSADDAAGHAAEGKEPGRFAVGAKDDDEDVRDGGQRGDDRRGVKERGAKDPGHPEVKDPVGDHFGGFFRRRPFGRKVHGCLDAKSGNGG